MHLHLGDGQRIERAVLEPCHLQYAQRFVIERDGPGRGENIRGLVDGQGTDAVASQQVGCGCADRTQAHQQDVDLLGQCGIHERFLYGRGLGAFTPGS